MLLLKCFMSVQQPLTLPRPRVTSFIIKSISFLYKVNTFFNVMSIRFGKEMVSSSTSLFSSQLGGVS